MQKQILTLVIILISTFAFSQGGVGINNANATPDNSAMLDVSSSNKGVLVPRIALTATTDATTIPTPATSLLVYNTATAGTTPTDVTPGFYYWDGTQWLRFVAGNIVGTDDQNLTAATLTGLTLQTDIESGASVTVDLSPIADSAFTQILNNADTLFSNTDFTDSLLSFIYNNSDTILSNSSFYDSIVSIIYNNGDTLLYKNSFITSLGDSLFLSQNFLDSITSMIYNTGDTLLYNTSFINALSDSIDSDVDSVILSGILLTVYESGVGYPVDLSNLQDGTGTDNQTLSLSGNTLTISGGNNITLTDNVNDADNDPTNEIELPATAVTNQLLTWNGAAWVAQNAPSGADNWGTQTIVAGTGLSGNGTTGSPLINTVVDTDTQLAEAQVDAYANNNGYLTSFTEVDGSVTNELQTISLTGTTATLSNSGGSFSINDADSNPTNEYNSGMTVLGGNLNIVDGGGTKSVSLAAINANDWHTNGNVGSASMFIGTTNSQAFKMRTGNVERMRIQANGDVGIGTPTPVHILDISEPKTNSTGTTVRIANEPGAGLAYANGPALVLEIPNIGYGERNVTGIFFNRMRENVEWYVGTEGGAFGGIPPYPAPSTEKFFISRNLKTSNAHVRTRPIYGNNTFFVIDNSGRVGLGMTNPSYKLTLPNNSATTIGQGRAYAWSTYSDGRLKTQLKEIEYGLDQIMSLQPLNYNQHNSSILDPNEDREFHKIIIDSTSTPQIGFIAQDLIKIIPEAVNKPEDENKDFWSVDYTRLIPVLVKGMQEQQLIIEGQKNNNKEQNIRINFLQQQLQQQQLQIEELKKLIEQK